MAKPANLTFVSTRSSSAEDCEASSTIPRIHEAEARHGPEQVETNADRLEPPAAVAENLNVGIPHQKGKNYSLRLTSLDGRMQGLLKKRPGYLATAR